MSFSPPPIICPELSYSIGAKDAKCYAISIYNLHKAVLETAKEKLKPLGLLTNIQMKIGYCLHHKSNSVYITDSKSTSPTKELYAYLLPMLHQHGEVKQSIFKKHQHQRRSGPTIIIMCSSVAHLRVLKSDIESLLENNNKYSNPISVKYQDVTNSSVECDIMLVHPGVLFKLLRKGHVGHQLFERLRYFVMEEFHAYLPENFKVAETMVHLINENVKIMLNRKIHVFARGTKWTPEMGTFCVDVLPKDSTTVHFESLREIANFANINCRVHYAENDRDKLLQLVQIIKNNQDYHDCIVIACKDNATRNTVYTYCSNAGIFLTDWESVSYSAGKILVKERGVYVIPDDMLNDIEVNQCTNVICFDTGAHEYSQGNLSVGKYRYHYFWNQLDNIPINGPPSIITPRLWMNQLVTGTESNFVKMLLFAESLKLVKIHPKLEQIWKEKKQEYLAMKDICKSFKLFGCCDDTSCSLRHEFIIADLKTNALAPFHGEVICKILSCINPSVYKVLMLQHYFFDSKSKKRIDARNYVEELRERKLKLADHYSNQRFETERLRQDEIYGLAINEEYLRVKIRTELDKLPSSDDPFLDVMCIDTNAMMRAQYSQLLPLPKKFQDWPSFVVKLILANVAPPRNELKYSRQSITAAQNLIKDSPYTAKVWVSIGDTAWVTPIVSPERISIRNVLLQNRSVSWKPNHLEHIVDCVKKLGTSYEGHYVLQTSINNSSEDLVRYYVDDRYNDCEIRWAYIKKSDKDEVHCETIFVTYVCHPWLIFGVLAKFKRLVETLEKELNSHLKGVILSQDEQVFEVDLCVAVMDYESEQYVRGVIVDQTYDTQMYTYSVFLADYGETISGVTPDKIIPLNKRFITELPFQAIAISLSHIKPNDGGDAWGIEEGDELLKLLIPENSKSKMIHVAVYGHEHESVDSYVPTNYYSAVVFSLAVNDEVGFHLAKRSLVTKAHVGVVYPISEGLRKLVSTEIGAPIPRDLNFEDHDDDDDEEDPLKIFDVVVDSKSDNQTPSGMFRDIQGMFEKRIDSDTEDTSLSYNGKNSSELAAVENVSHKVADGPVGSKDGHASSYLGACAMDLPLKTNYEKVHAKGLDKNLPKSADLRPKTMWHESLTTITLTVQLVDVRKFTVEVGDDSQTVSFRCFQPKNYGFKLTLFAKVKKNPEILLTGPCLKIFLAKKAKKTWIRLLFDHNEKHYWLTYNPDKVVCPQEQEEEEEDVLDFKRRISHQCVTFDKDGSMKRENDDDDSDDNS